MALYTVKSNCRYMYKLNLIAVITIVVTVSLVVTMASPAIAFAAQHENMTMINMDNNVGSMGNMTGGDNETSITETESLLSANETGICQPCCIGPDPMC